MMKMPTETPATTATPSKSSSGNNVALWITYINIVLYALCYQLQSPVEPYLVSSLTENHDDPDAVAKSYARLQSFFSTIQTIGSPLVGILLDRVGIKLASAVVFGASAASYGILSQATSMSLLFWSKVPTALQDAFLVAQATAATSTAGNGAARAQALGRMTTAYTIGATVGPALGGYLAGHGDLYVGARLAIVGSLLSVVLSLLYLPSSNSGSATTPSGIATTKGSNKKSSKAKRSFSQQVAHSVELAMRSGLWPLLAVKVIGGVSASIHSTALPLVLTQVWKFEPSQLGLSMSSAMFAVAAFGAFAMGPLTSWVGPSFMAKQGLVQRALLASVLAAILTSGSSSSSTTAATRSMVMQVVTLGILHGLSSHILATGLTTQTTGAVAKDEQGALLGLEHGLFSLARIVAPPMATSLLASAGGMWAVAGACGTIDLALVYLLAWKGPQISKKKASPP